MAERPRYIHSHALHPEDISTPSKAVAVLLLALSSIPSWIPSGAETNYLEGDPLCSRAWSRCSHRPTPLPRWNFIGVSGRSFTNRAAPCSQSDTRICASQKDFKSRRFIIETLTAILSLPHTAIAALDKTRLQKILSSVPVFMLVNKQGLPYLLGSDQGGNRFGYYYLSPGDAIKEFQDASISDPDMSLKTLYLDQIWSDVSRSVMQVSRVDANTRTNNSFILIRPLSKEEENAKIYLPPAVANIEGVLPLFYEPSLRITVDGKIKRPYFLSFTDLVLTFERKSDAGDNRLNERPEPKATTLRDLLQRLDRGEESNDVFLVAYTGSRFWALLPKTNASAMNELLQKRLKGDESLWMSDADRNTIMPQLLLN